MPVVVTGQQRRTRIVRLLANDTVEKAILHTQAAKNQIGDDTLLAAEANTSAVMDMIRFHP